MLKLAGAPETLRRYQAIAALASRRRPEAEALLRRELNRALATTYERDYLLDAADHLALPDLRRELQARFDAADRTAIKKTRTLVSGDLAGTIPEDFLIVSILMSPLFITIYQLFIA